MVAMVAMGNTFVVYTENGVVLVHQLNSHGASHPDYRKRATLSLNQYIIKNVV
jgi:hypothetical protein